jgi:hypothetical protein
MVDERRNEPCQGIEKFRLKNFVSQIQILQQNFEKSK